MKKGAHAVLAVTLIFICVLVGFFMGRVTTRIDLTSQDFINGTDQPTAHSSEPSNDESISDGRININTATSHQLQMLPNIGEILANRIIEYRTENGPFSTIEDLVLVKGIGDKRMEELRQYISVGG